MTLQNYISMKTNYTILLMLFISNFATAQQSQVKLECNEPLMMGALCSCVSDRRQDTRDDSPYEYEFEERIYRLACVDIEKDTKEMINKKIHDWWVKNDKNVVCSGTSFHVMRGSILILAVYRSFTEFLDKAVYDWKVPLNTVDESDRRKTLDYIKDELERSRGQVNEKALKDYYDLLRRNGAKHKAEL